MQIQWQVTSPKATVPVTMEANSDQVHASDLLERAFPKGPVACPRNRRAVLRLERPSSS